MTVLPEQGLSQTLRMAQAGHQDAADQLLEICRNYVQVQAQRELQGQLAPRVDASDIVQQTLLDAWQGLAQFRGTTTVELVAWLKQIVCRNAIDAARMHGVAQKRTLDRQESLDQTAAAARSNPPPQIEIDQLSPSQQAIQAEEELMLADAIAQLPDDYRQVLICRSLLRMSFGEVAQQMDRSGPAVQMLWARAVDQLRRILPPRDPNRVQPRRERPS